MLPAARHCGHDRKFSSSSTAACQRERRRLWQRAKRASDADYRDNQAWAQRAWAANHREYWREYRRRHQPYCERNREAAGQRQHDRRQASASAAVTEFAKMDACLVEITLISTR